MSDDTPHETPDDAPTERFTPPKASEPTPAEQTPAQPTRRFAQPEDDAPTERFPVAGEPAAAAPPPFVRETVTQADDGVPPPRRKLAGWTIALIVIGAVLLVAVIIALVLLFTRGGGTPASTPSPTASSPSPTPTQTQSPSPTPTKSSTPTPPPVSPSPAFTSFTPADNSPVACPNDDAESTVPLAFAWTSTGASLAWIGVDTTNAKQNPTASVPPSGTYSAFQYDCSKATRVYTVTLDDGSGNLTSKTVTLDRQLPQ
jgi:cytoskeletal protein RodZ